MSHVQLDESSQLADYRALSISAVATLILGVISVPALFIPSLLVIPAIGLAVGVFAVLSLRNRREEYSGYPLATVGVVASLFCLLAGAGRAAWLYATEVPEGYARISFAQLQPDLLRAPQLPISPDALALDGKKVFVSGYVHPSGLDRQAGIKHFILVPDMKTCCFGGQPALTDMIEVTLKDPNRINYSYARRRLAGTLKVSPSKKPLSDLDGVYYQLEADIVK